MTTNTRARSRALLQVCSFLPLDTDTPAPKLTPRQTAFVAEYLIDLNGTQAAIRAGYSPHTANEQAAFLLANISIAAAVARGMAQRSSRVNMTQDTVLHEMAILAKSSLDHYVIDDDGQVQLTESAPLGAMGAIQSIKKKTRVHYDKDGEVVGKTYDVEIRLWDKPAPLKLMGRHVGLFPNRVEHVGKDGGPIKFSELSDDELAARAASLAADLAKEDDE